MNEANFLKRLGALVTGEGFVREKDVPLPACIATGAAAAALSSNVVVITFDANNESITVPFKVPLDYDETLDELTVVLTALLTTGDGSTNAISLDLDQVKLARPGQTAVTDKTSDVTSQPSNVVSADIAEYVFEVSGNDVDKLGLKAGDCMSIEIDAQETGTGVATVYGVSVRYRSDLAAYDWDNRETVDVEITN